MLSLVQPETEPVAMNSQHHHELTPGELAEYLRRADPARAEGDLEAAMADPVWRLGAGKLYKCLDQNGREVTFLPTAEQRLILWCIHGRGWRRLIIPKARQLGMSLVLCLIGLDLALWRSGYKAALVDKTEDDAKKKLREKVLFALDRLPAGCRAPFVIKASASGVSFKEAEGEAPESTYEADVSFRGGTVEFLHISEWGEVQMKQRERSREIRDGSLPAVERAADGICVVETTWQGGLDGELGPLVREAQHTPEQHKGPRSWRVLFFPWHTNALYAQAHGHVDAESRGYFAECARLGVHLGEAQQKWYAEKRRTLGLRAARSQFPTLAHECWETTPEGSIYGALVEQSRAAGRMLAYEPSRSLVHTFWDIGAPLNTVCWLVQITPGEIRVLDVDMELDLTLQDRFARIQARGWLLGCHYLPHDAGIRQSSGRSQADDFTAVFGPTVRVVPRVHSVWQGIDSLRALWPRLVFRLPACATGLEHLGRYASLRETSSGIAREEPIHDRYSHAADALRQLAQAIDAGMIEGGGSVTGVAAARTEERRAIMGMRG